MKAQIFNLREWVNETDGQKLYCKYKQLLELAGFNIVGEVEHWFTPQGYTCLFLLSESHFAVHTFPEEGKTYIELSSCNKKYFDNFKKLSKL